MLGRASGPLLLYITADCGRWCGGDTGGLGGTAVGGQNPVWGRRGSRPDTESQATLTTPRLHRTRPAHSQTPLPSPPPAHAGTRRLPGETGVEEAPGTRWGAKKEERDSWPFQLRIQSSHTVSLIRTDEDPTPRAAGGPIQGQGSLSSCVWQRPAASRQRGLQFPHVCHMDDGGGEATVPSGPWDHSAGRVLWPVPSMCRHPPLPRGRCAEPGSVVGKLNVLKVGSDKRKSRTTNEARFSPSLTRTTKVAD